MSGRPDFLQRVGGQTPLPGGFDRLKELAKIEKRKEREEALRLSPSDSRLLAFPTAILAGLDAVTERLLTFPDSQLRKLLLEILQVG